MKYSFMRRIISLFLILNTISFLPCAFAGNCDIRQLTEEEQKRLYTMGEIYETEGKPKAAAIAFGKAGNYSNARERSFALWNTVLYRGKTGSYWMSSLSLNDNGSVYMVDLDNSYPELAEELRNTKDVIQIAYGSLCSGDFDAAFLKKDGTVFSTDDRKSYSNLSNVVKLTDGDFVLLCDGRVIDGHTQETIFEDITDIIGVANQHYTSYACLRLDGTVITDYLFFTQETKQKIAALDNVVSLGYEDDDFIFYCGNGAVYSFKGGYENDKKCYEE